MLPHESWPPVPRWFIKLHVRWCLRRGQYVPPEYRTPYWAGKWARNG